jgi:cofilin
MANTGVVPTPEVISEFENIQLKRIKAKFVIYKIENKANIVTEKLSESADFEEFKNSMPADDCRFGVYDFDYTTHDGRPNNKLVFVSW